MENRFLFAPRFWLQLLVLIVAGLWIYAPVLHGDWIWDDRLFIPENPYLHDPHRLWKIWFFPQGFIEYYPITATVQLAQWDLCGMDTFGYHFTNVILHITGALLFWRLLEKLGTPLAWFGAMLFTVHPLMVESVAWMSELKNTLSLIPFLLTMLVYLDYDRDRRAATLVLSLLLFLLAMLTKTSCMMFPFIILLYAWWKRGRVDFNDLLASSGFFLISFALGCLSLWIGQFQPQPTSHFPDASILEKMGAIGWVIVSFLTKFIIPIGLLPDYPTGVVRAPAVCAPIPWLLVAGLFWLAWSHRRDWGRTVIFAFGFFLINLLPVAFFIMTHYVTMAWSMDHLGYISLMGLCGLVPAACGYWAAKGTPQLGGLIQKALFVIGFLLAVDAHIYAGYFINTDTLWTYAARYFFASQPVEWITHEPRPLFA